MTHAHHDLARTFFTALSSGVVPDDLLTEDVSVWTTLSGLSQGGRAHYQGGIRMLASIFSGGVTYSVDSLTAEDDRVAAEVQGRGVLVNGETYHNVYVFMLRIRDGRIASIAEHFDPRVTIEKIMPLMMAAMSKAQG